MGDKANDLEAEILRRNDRVRTISYCNTKGEQEQIGPHFIEMFPSTTRDGVDYWHGRILDGRAGHYSTKDGSEAFGGPTDDISNNFEDIDGKSYKRVKEKDRRVALKDVRGGRYTGYAHDSMQRDHSTHLEDQGTVYHVTDDGKEGYFLDEKLCGKKNGMNHKTTIVKVGDKIYLVAEDKEGKKKVVDIKTGEIKFGDEAKCTDIELLMVGTEVCAKKTYGKTQEVRDESGKAIYYGLRARVGEWFKGPGGPFARTYDDDAKLTVVDRRGKARFGTENPVYMEANDSPNENGVYEIDHKTLLKLFVENPDPKDEDDALQVTFRDQNGVDPFRGPHDELAKSEKGRPNMVNIAGITSLLFKKRSTKAIYWTGSNGKDMFGGHHWDDLKTIEWKYDHEGRRLGDSTILKHFVEMSKGHVVLDYQANPFFKDAKKESPEHTSIRDFLVLSYKKDGEGRNVLVAETEDSVGLGRRIKSALLRLPTFWRGGVFDTPSTYYLLDGKKADSIGALKQSLGAPDDATLVNVDDFEDALVTTSKARDTQRIQLRTAPKDQVSPKVRALLDQAQAATASSAEPAPQGVEVVDEKIILPGDASAEIQPVETIPSDTERDDMLSPLPEASSLAGMLSEGLLDDDKPPAKAVEEPPEQLPEDSGEKPPEEGELKGPDWLSDL